MTVRTRDRLSHLFLLIPSWDGPTPDPEEKRGPATTSNTRRAESLKTLEPNMPNREEPTNLEAIHTAKIRNTVLVMRLEREIMSRVGDAAMSQTDHVLPQQKMPKLIVVAAFDQDEEASFSRHLDPNISKRRKPPRARRTRWHIHAGVVAWPREAGPTLGEFGPPTLLLRAGDVPGMEWRK